MDFAIFFFTFLRIICTLKQKVKGKRTITIMQGNERDYKLNKYNSCKGHKNSICFNLFLFFPNCEHFMHHSQFVLQK